MTTSRWSVAALVLSLVFVGACDVRAHQNPVNCSQPGEVLLVSTFRADGVTPVSGPVKECESIVYQIVLRKTDAGDRSICAFSGGTLTFTDPHGTATTIEADVPCIGGDATPAPGCSLTDVTASIPYMVTPEDVHGGAIPAFATYVGGVLHDQDIDTPGIMLSTPKGISVTFCGDGIACNGLEVCDPALRVGPSLGSCAPGVPLLCNRGNQCQDDVCVEPDGCTLMPKLAGTACETDVEPCTIEQCDGRGACRPAGCIKGCRPRPRHGCRHGGRGSQG